MKPRGCSFVQHAVLDTVPCVVSSFLYRPMNEAIVSSLLFGGRVGLGLWVFVVHVELIVEIRSASAMAQAWLDCLHVPLWTYLKGSRANHVVAHVVCIFGVLYLLRAGESEPVCQTRHS